MVMEPLKPTFSEVVYANVSTFVGRYSCKGCFPSIKFFVSQSMAICEITTIEGHVGVCCELDCPDLRHESIGPKGESTHPGRFTKNLPPLKNGCTCDLFVGPHREDCPARFTKTPREWTNEDFR